MATVGYLLASMALMVGSSPGNDVLSSRSASSVTIDGVIVGVAKTEGPTPGVMKPGGQCLGLRNREGSGGLVCKPGVLKERRS